MLNATHALWGWYRNQDDSAEAAEEVHIERRPACKAPLGRSSGDRATGNSSSGTASGGGTGGQQQALPQLGQVAGRTWRRVRGWAAGAAGALGAGLRPLLGAS